MELPSELIDNLKKEKPYKKEAQSSCKVQCGISGLEFTCSYAGALFLEASAGYFHPIFAASQEQLYSFYKAHTKGQLSPTDSYLLFLAFAHSSGQIEWAHHATLSPASPKAVRIVENNMRQLVSALEKSAVITHKDFAQPSYRVTAANSELRSIGAWIAEWEENISCFTSGRIDDRTLEQLKEVENRLSTLILSGEKPANYAEVIASWACKAADFPASVAEEWKLIIRSCYSVGRIEKFPIETLKSVREYCECNIEAGSIHFHTLHATLCEGVKNHEDYLGVGFRILPACASGNENESESEKELAEIVQAAPSTYPKAEDYPDSLSFLKAKLAYRVGGFSK